MQITIKIKKSGRYEEADIPQDISVPTLRSWIGKPCVLEAVDGTAKTYAYGNEEVRGAWEDGKHVVTMEIFCFNYQYGFNAFARAENTEERIAICEAEKVAPEEIAAIISSQPTLYATEEMR